MIMCRSKIYDSIECCELRREIKNSLSLNVFSVVSCIQYRMIMEKRIHEEIYDFIIVQISLWRDIQ